MSRVCLWFIGLVVPIVFTSCVTYKEKPLEPHMLFEEVEESLQFSSENEREAPSFFAAAEIMSQHNPELKEIQLEYEALQNVANIKTPWSNPRLEVGPDIGSNLAKNLGNKVQPFVALGFAIPLAGKLKNEDELNKVKAKRSLIDVQAKHRELYFDLRGCYSKLHIAFEKKRIQQKLVSSANAMVKTAEAMIKVGGTSALDVGMLQLEGQKTKLELIEIEHEIHEQLSILSVLLGKDVCEVNQLPKNILPKLPLHKPDINSLKSLLAENHINLAKLRYDYLLAEKQLKLEVSRQYPDLNFGLEREEEVGGQSSLLGLRFGIDLPIFNQNKQAIAFALKRREKIKKAYLVKVHHSLAQLKLAYENIDIHIKKGDFIKKQILTNSKKNLEIAKQALENGAIDVLKYLDVLRSYQKTEKDILMIESEMRGNWTALERVVGYPLLEFPDEKTTPIFKQSLSSLDIKENDHE